MNDQIHPEEHTEQEQPDLSPERPRPRRQRSWSGTLTLAFSFLAMLLAGMALLLAVLDRPAKEPEEEPAGPATFQFGEQTLEVLEGMPLQPYDWRSFSTESLGGGRRRAVYRQNGRSARTGIDISFYQGEIDWQAVAGDGIDFVILRLGYRGYTEGGLMQDKNYVQNLQGALNAGLDVGVYFFSQAITPQEAEEEADYILSVLNGAPLAYPIAFDWEHVSDPGARSNGLDGAVLTQCAKAFCARIREGGYEPAVYFNQNLGYLQYDLRELEDSVLWLAELNSPPKFYYHFDLWQYSHTGTVAGIQGEVDMDLDLRPVLDAEETA